MISKIFVGFCLLFSVHEARCWYFQQQSKDWQNEGEHFEENKNRSMEFRKCKTCGFLFVWFYLSVKEERKVKATEIVLCIHKNMWKVKRCL